MGRGLVWGVEMQRESIHVGEARAAVNGLRHAARSVGHFGSILLFLGDNLGVTLCMTRGRSSDHGLLVQCRRVLALLLATGCSVSWRWIASEVNPADVGSRQPSARAREIFLHNGRWHARDLFGDKPGDIDDSALPCVGAVGSDALPHGAWEPGRGNSVAEEVHRRFGGPPPLRGGERADRGLELRRRGPLSGRGVGELCRPPLPSGSGGTCRRDSASRAPGQVAFAELSGSPSSAAVLSSPPSLATARPRIDQSADALARGGAHRRRHVDQILGAGSLVHFARVHDLLQAQRSVEPSVLRRGATNFLGDFVGGSGCIRRLGA